MGFLAASDHAWIRALHSVQGKNSQGATMPPTIPPAQKSKLEIESSSDHNVQASKKFIFNETGNIMLATTEMSSDNVTDSVREIFAEVAVFFAAMTKAISTSINPTSKKRYSLYDVEAIQNVIDGSGLFVQVTEEDIVHKTNSFGATFSKELIEGLVGLATGVGGLAFAQGMISSIGKQGLNLCLDTSTSKSQVGNIIFVCEYLLGMPIVSALVVSCDAQQVSQTFKAGPCFSETSTTTSLTLHKDTYMFVTPTFIKKYSGDLDAVTTDLQFLEFVDYLQAIVLRRPIITAVESMDGKPAPSALKVNTTYAITGAFLSGNNLSPEKVKVAWVEDGKAGSPVANAEVQDSVITFSIAAPTDKAAAIGVFFDNVLAVATPFTYTTDPVAGKPQPKPDEL
jgi:hypothetical protein